MQRARAADAWRRYRRGTDWNGVASVQAEGTAPEHGVGRPQAAIRRGCLPLCPAPPGTLALTLSRTRWYTRTARRQPVARLNRIRSDGPESAAPDLRLPSARRGVHRTPFAVGRGDLPRGAGEAGLATTLGPEVGAFGSVVQLW